MSLLEKIFPPGMRILDAAGIPAPAARIYTYAAGGGSSSQATYSDVAGITPNANPVICDSAGLVPPIFVLPLAYRILIMNGTGAVTIADHDNVAGPQYYSLLDQGWILKNVSNQAKQMQMDLSGLSAARTVALPDVAGTLLESTWGVMGAAPFARAVGTGLAAANDLAPATDGDIFIVTGNTQINRISYSGQSGNLRTELYLTFTGTPTIKHGQASGGAYRKIFLNGSVDLVAAANTCLHLVLVGGEWHEFSRKVA